MLQDKDRIFTNLYGTHSPDLEAAKQKLTGETEDFPLSRLVLREEFGKAGFVRPLDIAIFGGMNARADVEEVEPGVLRERVQEVVGADEGIVGV